jgi:hypothetical protein
MPNLKMWCSLSPFSFARPLRAFAVSFSWCSISRVDRSFPLISARLGMPASLAAEIAKEAVGHHVQDDFKMLILGISLSKTVAAPFERAKLLLQNQAERVTITRLPYNGLVDVLLRSPQEQGLASLWRGNTTSVLRFLPVMIQHAVLRRLLHP